MDHVALFKDYTAMLRMAGALDDEGYENVTRHLENVRQDAAGALSAKMDEDIAQGWTDAQN